MLVYTALILAVGTLYLSAAEGGTQCKQVSAKTDFDKKQYFNEVWYVTHYKDENPGQYSGKYCSIFAAQMSDKSINEAVCHYKPDDKSTIYDVSRVTEESGKYTAYYKKVDEKGNEIKGMDINNNKYTVTVMEADRSSALIHICLQRGDENLGDLYAILNRQKDVDASDVIKNTLSKTGLTLSEFSSTKGIGCEYNEGTLISLLEK
uniref:Nitrophorin domain-containing protein n=1 Tax=Rhodnius prolixus TaxID=13249 RepID=T1H7S8_RHOPR